MDPNTKRRQGRLLNVIGHFGGRPKNDARAGQHKLQAGGGGAAPVPEELSVGRSLVGGDVNRPDRVMAGEGRGNLHNLVDRLRAFQ